MDPLSAAGLTASVITVIDFTAKVISYLHSMKDASKERVRCAIEASNIFNLLTNLSSRLEEASPRDPWFTAVRALATDNGPLDQFKAVLEQLMSKLTPADGLRRIGKALVWKIEKGEVMDILSRIERFKSLIQVALEMDHFKLSQAVKEDSIRIREGVSELEEGFQRMQRREVDSEHRIIADWLTPIDFAAQQSDFTSRRQEGTGLWFLGSPEFTTWLDGTKQTLFCPGIPGAGKTTITSIVVDHLWTTFEDGKTGIAYLYCNYKRREEQRAVDLLAALLKQLVRELLSTPQQVKDLYEHHLHRRTRPTFDEVFKVLCSVVTGYSRVFVVIDALDECVDTLGTRSKILSAVRNLQTQADIRLMATSRFNSNIMQEFKEDNMLEIRASNADVKRYIEGQIPRLSRCVQRNLDLQESLKRDITNGVDGMFLLAQLHLDSLIDKITVKAIKSALEKLPKGSEALKGAYEEAVERINSQSQSYRHLAQNVISWIVNAQRPLTTTELQHALAIELGERELDEDNLPAVEDMTSVCLGLVTVDDESNIIRLVHYTTQDYFETLQVDWIVSAPARIASMCITYLSFDVFASEDYHVTPDDDELDSEQYTYAVTMPRLAYDRFLDYAATHWGGHARKAEEEVKNLALQFLQSKGNVTCFIQVMAVQDITWRYCTDKKFSWQQRGLYVAARLGLPTLLMCLLEDSGLRDAKDKDGRTPLSWAAAEGHTAVVELLANRDHFAINVDAGDIIGRTPLSWAAREGHKAVVKLLLDQNDVDAESQDKYSQTPLSWAANEGHEAVVKLLLDHNADPNITDYEGRTALWTAAYEGHTTTVKLLLDHNANPNITDDESQTALYIAADHGHTTIVQQLLDHNADPNIRDYECQTALEVAAYRGHTAIVKLLLDHNANPNIKDDEGQTTLSMTAYQGHTAIVKLLLDHNDLDAYSQARNSQTLLLWAAIRGHKAVVRLLLDHNADQNSTDDYSTAEYSETALCRAAIKGHDTVVKLLLDHDADPNATNEWGETALHQAACYSHPAIVKLLLHHNADPNRKNYWGETALNAAAGQGHIEVVKLLLDHNADPNIKDDEGRTALDVAAKRGRLEVMEILKPLTLAS